MPAPITPTTFAELVEFFLGFINVFIALIFILAFIVIVWKLIDGWIIHPDQEEKRKNGRTLALTAIIVLAIMASLWGILALLQASFGTV